MKRKSKILIIVIIIVVALFAIFFNPITNPTDNFIKVGDATFDLPNEYHENKTDSGELSITDGSHSIYFKEYNDSNITDYVLGYENFKLEKGYNSTITNFTIDGTQIYKLTVPSEPGNTQYWFIHNDKVYSIYSWTYTPEIDSIVINLIKSVH